MPSCSAELEVVPDEKEVFLVFPEIGEARSFHVVDNQRETICRRSSSSQIGGFFLSLHVHVKLPSRQVAQPQVPWRPNGRRRWVFLSLDAEHAPPSVATAVLASLRARAPPESRRLIAVAPPRARGLDARRTRGNSTYVCRLSGLETKPRCPPDLAPSSQLWSTAAHGRGDGLSSRVLSLDRRYSIRLCVRRVCRLSADG